MELAVGQCVLDKIDILSSPSVKKQKIVEYVFKPSSEPEGTAEWKKARVMSTIFVLN